MKNWQEFTTCGDSSKPDTIRPDDLRAFLMSLLKTLATVSSMTLLSRILGFVRDFAIARTFGASLATDAFVVAFRLPNLLRRLFAEGAFSQAFVPILAEDKNRRGEEDTKLLVDHVSGVLAGTLAPGCEPDGLLLRLGGGGHCLRGPLWVLLWVPG